ncbi:MAG: transglutaminase domain-containing protein [Clostridia bacterium]|jgi:transglutaminase-like putative cysteine protease
MNREEWINHISDCLLTCMFSIGISHSILGALSIPFPLWKLSLWVFFTYGALTALFWNRRIQLFALSSILISLIGYLILTIQTGWFSFHDFGSWAVHFILGLESLSVQYASLFVFLLVLSITSIGFLFIHKKFVFWPLLTLSTIIFLLEWFSQYRDLFLPLLLVLLSLVLLFGRSYLQRTGQTGYGAWQLWCFPIVFALVLLAFIAAPRKPYAWKWDYLETKVENINEFLGEYISFTKPRAGYSLSQTGFQPLGDRLGGPTELDNEKVLRVKSPYPVYLRGSIYNEYTGTSWKDTTNSKRYRMDSTAWKKERETIFNLNLPNPTTLSRDIYNKYVEDIEIEITTLKEGPSSLFSPNRVYDILSKDRWTIIPYYNSQGETFSIKNVPAQTSYIMKVKYLHKEIPEFRQLANSLSSRSGAEARGDDGLRRTYCQLPPNYSRSVAQLARFITQDHKMPYDKALALERYLRSYFVYSLTPDVPPQDKDFVEHFLETKKGYCTYFASAMAVMARTLSLPARYVEGYVLPASSWQTDSYEITNRHAHAWVEIYFDRIGWLTFDPSPPVFHSSSSYASGDPEIFINPYGDFLMKQEDESLREGVKIDADREKEAGAQSYLTVLPFLIVMGIVLTCILLLLLFRFHPRLVSRLYPQKGKQVWYYFQDILRILSFTDTRLLPGETLYEYADRVDAWLENSEGGFRKMIDILMAVQFGKQAVSGDDVRTLYSFHKQLARFIRHRQGFMKYYAKRIFLSHHAPSIKMPN